ncbi:MAG: hypothetical protein AVO33_01465 [delta proteobacterium ML8_F1]|nr:MAG: hypothetical protein AVO33_01465 [delta proteobacterium ML8_F1]
MYDVMKAMAARESVRTFQEGPLSPNQVRVISTEANRIMATGGPFAQGISLRLISGETLGPKATFGVVRHAPAYILGSCSGTREALVDLGFGLEQLVLFITALGFGTCWIAGTYRPGDFARFMPGEEGSRLAAVTPVGLKKNQKTLVDRTFKILSGASRRLSFKQWVFTGDFDTPYDEETYGGIFSEVLEGVSRAPSGRNGQPWRLLLEEDRARVHFYVAKSATRYLDIGIAMAHFELGAEALGITGGLEVEKHPPRGPYEYILSYRY